MGLGISEWYLGYSSEALLGNMEYGYVVWSGVYQHHYSKSKTNNLGYNTYYSNNSIVILIYMWTWWIGMNDIALMVWVWLQNFLGQMD
jgi:hypothetical protein